jgi:hypothetical protein
MADFVALEIEGVQSSFERAEEIECLPRAVVVTARYGSQARSSVA